MMNIVVAGTNGFAQYLVDYIKRFTVHNVLVLSQRGNPGLERRGWQIVQTDYQLTDQLVFHLLNVDVVISTIAGSAQLVLIDAAIQAQVRKFVPSEFRGKPYQRSLDDPTDGGRRAALEKLALSGLSFTTILCGVFYEAFAPGGLAASQINISKSLGQEGDFLFDIRSSTTMMPHEELACGTQLIPCDDRIFVSLTSAQDAARYVVEALSLDLAQWPHQFIFCAERFSLRDLISICQEIAGTTFRWTLCDIHDIRNPFIPPLGLGNFRAAIQRFHLLATVEGQFDLPPMDSPNLDPFINVGRQDFREWLRNVWASAGRGD